MDLSMYRKLTYVKKSCTWLSLLCALGLSAVMAMGLPGTASAVPLSGIHATPTPPFPLLGDGHHLRWFGLDEIGATPETDVSYSFTWTAAVTAFFGGGDVSTAAQMARVRDSFVAWEAVTPGLRFFEVPGIATISVGTAANFATTGSPGALGLGGGLGFVHGGLPDTGPTHHLTDALAVQNSAIAWHNGAGAPPAGLFDYLTVATQEVGPPMPAASSTRYQSRSRPSRRASRRIRIVSLPGKRGPLSKGRTVYRGRSSPQGPSSRSWASLDKCRRKNDTTSSRSSGCVTCIEL